MPGAFRMDVRVRLSETDALGVVYYGQYLTYFDLSRLEMLREAGITPQYLGRRGLGFVAGEVACRYHSSAKFDDVLRLDVRVEKVGRSSVTYSHEITRGGARVATGKVTDVMVGAGGRPATIPEAIRKKLSMYSA